MKNSNLLIQHCFYTQICEFYNQVHKSLLAALPYILLQALFSHNYTLLSILFYLQESTVLSSRLDKSI